jgi:hypothetical protein
MTNENVLDLSVSVYPDINMVALIQEMDDHWMVMILKCTDGENDWGLHLLLRFDLIASWTLHDGRIGGDEDTELPSLSDSSRASSAAEGSRV